MANRKNKFNAEKTTLDGITFDSKAEADRYAQLMIRHRARQIRGLRIHRRYPLVVNGIEIAIYEADFFYFDIAAGCEVVEDVKGVRTREYRIKKRLMKALYGINIVEIQV